MRRLRTILLSYVFAAAMGVLGLVITWALNAFFSGGSLGWKDAELIFGFGFLFAVLTGWLIALPLVILSETQSRFGSGWERGWKAYALGGALYGLILSAMTGASSLEIAATFIPATAVAGIAYWLMAWRWLPPPAHES